MGDVYNMGLLSSIASINFPKPPGVGLIWLTSTVTSARGGNTTFATISSPNFLKTPFQAINSYNLTGPVGSKNGMYYGGAVNFLPLSPIEAWAQNFLAFKLPGSVDKTPFKFSVQFTGGSFNTGNAFVVLGAIFLEPIPLSSISLTNNNISGETLTYGANTSDSGSFFSNNGAPPIVNGFPPSGYQNAPYPPFRTSPPYTFTFTKNAVKITLDGS